MSGKIRLAILGAGEMARQHIESIKGSDLVEVAGVSGAGSASIERIAAAYGVAVYDNNAELVDTADAVDVCLPTFMHRKAVIAAAGAGKHVLCEKPIALTLEEARGMIEASCNAGVCFMVAHCLRFWPEYVFLKELVDSGKYGRIVSLTAWRHGGFPLRASRSWLPDPEKSGGPVIDLHIHDADMVRYVIGPPAGVSAREARSEWVWAAAVDYEYPGGPSVRAEAGWYLEKGYPFRQGYRAVFEDAVVEFHSDSPRPVIVYTEEGPEEQELPVADAYRDELEYFAGCVLDGRDPGRSSAGEAAEALRLVLSARESAISGKRVKIGRPDKKN